MPMFRDVPHKIIALLQQCQYPHTKLTPKSVREWLRAKLKNEELSVAAAMLILQYISEDKRMDQLYGLPVFLCKDGQLRSLVPCVDTPNINHFKSKLYVGTEEESVLFDEKGELFLSLEKYPGIVSACIQNFAQTSEALNLEPFCLQTFVSFARDVLFPSPNVSNNQDICEMSSCGVDLAWIQKLWIWLDSKPVDEVAKAANKMWLLPLKGGKFLRRVRRLPKVN